MATIKFQTLSFQEKGNELQVTLLKHFITSIPKEELDKIGLWKLKDANTIIFKQTEQEKTEIKFFFLLEKYFHHLKTKLTGNNAIYIHKNSGIPLMGNPAFGIVYRNSSLIEIKPITSCNLDCIYCSVGEGLSSKKTDFVVEKDYLLEELKKLIQFVGVPVEVHVGVQGEPFFYEPIEELMADLEKMERVKIVSIDTNGTLLTKEKVERLSQYKKLQLNMSLDAMDEKLAKKIAGIEHYNLNHVLEMITLISKLKMNMIIAPVMMQNINESEMEKIIIFAKSLPNLPILGIQNFLPYKTGRIAAKQLGWEKFFAFLSELEKKYQVKLRLHERDFGIIKTKELNSPFSVGDKIYAWLKCPDRFPNSSIAVAKDRMISVPLCPFVRNKKVNLEITRDKHNIFSGNWMKG